MTYVGTQHLSSDLLLETGSLFGLEVFLEVPENIWGLLSP